MIIRLEIPSDLGSSLRRINMKLVKILFLTIALSLPATCLAESFYDFSSKTASGEHIEFSEYKGKVVLATNVATKCSFTPQLTELEKLYQKHREKGFIVLAFPSADHSPYEAIDNEGAHSFCSKQHGVSFPVFAYRKVKGEGMCPIFVHLTKQCDQQHAGEVGSSFEKFLLDKTGKVRARFGPFTGPMSMRLNDKIEELLSEEASE